MNRHARINRPKGKHPMKKAKTTTTTENDAVTPQAAHDATGKPTAKKEASSKKGEPKGKKMAGTA